MDRGNRAFSELVKKRRESFGLTQEEVSERIGMSLRAYQYLEAGKTRITIDKEIKLLRLMRDIYFSRTGFLLDEEKDNESIASHLKDLVLGLLKG